MYPENFQKVSRHLENLFNFLNNLYTRNSPEVPNNTFFSRTLATQFCMCAQDSYTSLYKRFRVNSTSFIRVQFAK